MNRVIFQDTRIMSEMEQHYFDLIDTTNDNHGVSYEHIIRYMNDLGYQDIDERLVRTWNERWNEFKYLNVIPTYNIKKVKTILPFKHSGIKYRFRKIITTSEHSQSVLDKSRLDMIEYIMKYRNRLRVLGSVNTFNSMTMEQILEEVE